jgi:hypothetical protein
VGFVERSPAEGWKPPHKKEPSQAPFHTSYIRIFIWLYFPSLMRMAVLLTTGMSAAITQRIVSTPMVVKLYIKE